MNNNNIISDECTFFYLSKNTDGVIGLVNVKKYEHPDKQKITEDSTVCERELCEQTRGN
jgi:predicted RNA-binding protein with PUA-like domain